jgi:hypothetical protein
MLSASRAHTDTIALSTFVGFDATVVLTMAGRAGAVAPDWSS